MMMAFGRCFSFILPQRHTFLLSTMRAVISYGYRKQINVHMAAENAKWLFEHVETKRTFYTVQIF